MALHHESSDITYICDACGARDTHPNGPQDQNEWYQVIQYRQQPLHFCEITCITTYYEHKLSMLSKAQEKKTVKE